MKKWILTEIWWFCFLHMCHNPQSEVSGHAVAYACYPDELYLACSIEEGYIVINGNQTYLVEDSCSSGDTCCWWDKTCEKLTVEASPQRWKTLVDTCDNKRECSLPSDQIHDVFCFSTNGANNELVGYSCDRDAGPNSTTVVPTTSRPPQKSTTGEESPTTIEDKDSTTSEETTKQPTASTTQQLGEGTSVIDYTGETTPVFHDDGSWIQVWLPIVVTIILVPVFFCIGCALFWLYRHNKQKDDSHICSSAKDPESPATDDNNTRNNRRQNCYIQVQLQGQQQNETDASKPQEDVNGDHDIPGGDSRGLNGESVSDVGKGNDPNMDNNQHSDENVVCDRPPTSGDEYRTGDVADVENEFVTHATTTDSTENITTTSGSTNSSSSRESSIKSGAQIYHSEADNILRNNDSRGRRVPVDTRTFIIDKEDQQETNVDTDPSEESSAQSTDLHRTRGTRGSDHSRSSQSSSFSQTTFTPSHNDESNNTKITSNSDIPNTTSGPSDTSVVNFNIEKNNSIQDMEIKSYHSAENASSCAPCDSSENSDPSHSEPQIKKPEIPPKPKMNSMNFKTCL